MPTAELLQLHAFCVADAACRLLYGQSERHSIAVFETHLRLHMGTASVNATAIAARAREDVSFAVVSVLRGAANSNPCGAFMVPFEGLCRDLSPNQLDSDTPSTVLLILALAVLAVAFAYYGVKFVGQRMAHR